MSTKPDASGTTRMTALEQAEAIRQAVERNLRAGSDGLGVPVRARSVDVEEGRSGKYWIVVRFCAGTSPCTFGFRYPGFYEGEPPDSNTPEMWAEQLVASLHEAVETRPLPRSRCTGIVWVT